MWKCIPMMERERVPTEPPRPPGQVPEGLRTNASRHSFHGKREGILTQHGKSWWNYSQTSNEILMEPSHPWWEKHGLINVFLQPCVLPPLSAATVAVVGQSPAGKSSLLTRP